jgi:hypothetical protein
VGFPLMHDPLNERICPPSSPSNTLSRMLEVTNPGNEQKLGTDFAEVYRASEVARWVVVLPACQPCPVLSCGLPGCTHPLHPYSASAACGPPGAWRA